MTAELRSLGLVGSISSPDPSDVGSDVVIVAGQSNMLGIGTPIDPTYLDTADPRVSQFPGSGSFAGQVVSGADPLFHYAGAGGVGPATVFAKLWARSRPVNRDVLLVPVAQGGTGFNTTSQPGPPAGYGTVASGTWRVGGGGVNLYDFAVAQAKAAVALNPNNRVVAILWVQGEADTALTASQYATYLDAFITALRTNIPTAANALFITGSILPEYVTFAGAGAQHIQQALTDAPSRLPYVGHALDPGVGYEWTSDSLHIHYNPTGARLLGKALFSGALLAAKNALASVPVAPGVITFTQSGTTVTATWARTAGRVTNYKLRESVNGGGWTDVADPASVQNFYTRAGLTLGQTYQVQVAAINEQGTSAYSVSQILTLATIPAQVANLASPSQGSGNVALTWDASPTGTGQATSWLVEYKAHSSGTWLTARTATGTAATVTGLQSATSYDFRVTAINAAGSGTPSATLTQSTAASSILVSDVGVTPFGAWALRKVVSGYAGSAIKVRRSTDGTTQDIGFDGLGNLDTAALLTFCGAGNGFVDTIYDQSGNARHFAQTTAGKQGQIVTAGAVNTQGGRPCIAILASQAGGYTGSFSGLYAAGASSLLEVAQIKNTGTVSRFAEEGTSARNLISYVNAGASTFWQIVDDAASAWVNASGSVVADNAYHQVSSVDTGTQVQTWEDGTSKLGPTTYARAGHTLTLTRTSLMAWQSGGATFTFNLDGNWQEAVAWTSALTTGQRQLGESNQKSYYATP